MSKVIRELSDEEVWRLGLDDCPYIEEEFENIKNDDNVIGMAIPKDDNKIIKFPISTAEENIQDKKCDYKLLSTLISTLILFISLVSIILSYSSFSSI